MKTFRIGSDVLQMHPFISITQPPRVLMCGLWFCPFLTLKWVSAHLKLHWIYWGGGGEKVFTPRMTVYFSKASMRDECSCYSSPTIKFLRPSFDLPHHLPLLPLFSVFPLLQETWTPATLYSIVLFTLAPQRVLIKKFSHQRYFPLPKNPHSSDWQVVVFCMSLRAFIFRLACAKPSSGHRQGRLKSMN